MPPEKIVCLLAGVAVWRIITMMGGNQPKSMEYIKRVSIGYDIDTFTDILLRHAVMVLARRHVAVTHHCHGLTLSLTATSEHLLNTACRHRQKLIHRYTALLKQSHIFAHCVAG